MTENPAGQPTRLVLLGAMAAAAASGGCLSADMVYTPTGVKHISQLTDAEAAERQAKLAALMEPKPYVATTNSDLNQSTPPVHHEPHQPSQIPEGYETHH